MTIRQGEGARQFAGTWLQGWVCDVYIGKTTRAEEGADANGEDFRRSTPYYRQTLAPAAWERVLKGGEIQGFVRVCHEPRDEFHGRQIATHIGLQLLGIRFELLTGDASAFYF